MLISFDDWLNENKIVQPTSHAILNFLIEELYNRKIMCNGWYGYIDINDWNKNYPHEYNKTGNLGDERRKYKRTLNFAPGKRPSDKAKVFLLDVEPKHGYQQKTEEFIEMKNIPDRNVFHPRFWKFYFVLNTDATIEISNEYPGLEVPSSRKDPKIPAPIMEAFEATKEKFADYIHINRGKNTGKKFGF
jgi:hypothetical protein